MVKLNKIYTRTGDDGTTGLVDGSRTPKHSARIEAIGAVDEANSALGFAVVVLSVELAFTVTALATVVVSVVDWANVGVARTAVATTAMTEVRGLMEVLRLERWSGFE